MDPSIDLYETPIVLRSSKHNTTNNMATATTTDVDCSTVLLQAADNVLAQKPVSCWAANESSSTHKAKNNNTTIDTTIDTTTPKSTITSNVNNLMEYLDNLNITPATVARLKTSTSNGSNNSSNSSLTTRNSQQEKTYKTTLSAAGAEGRIHLCDKENHQSQPASMTAATRNVVEKKDSFVVNEEDEETALMIHDSSNLWFDEPVSSILPLTPSNACQVFRCPSCQATAVIPSIVPATSLHASSSSNSSLLSTHDAPQEVMMQQIQHLWRQVRHERQSTRAWAQQVQTRVKDWIQEEELLLDCKKKKNASPLTTDQQHATTTTTPLHKDAWLDQLKQEPSPTPRAYPNSLDETSTRGVQQQEQQRSTTHRRYEEMENGTRVYYRNGTIREYYNNTNTNNNETIVTKFPNGDVEITNKKTRIYWHEAEHVKQITVFMNDDDDNVVIYEYPNGQRRIVKK